MPPITLYVRPLAKRRLFYRATEAQQHRNGGSITLQRRPRYTATEALLRCSGGPVTTERKRRCRTQRQKIRRLVAQISTTDRFFRSKSTENSCSFRGALLFPIGVAALAAVVGDDGDGCGGASAGDRILRHAPRWWLEQAVKPPPLLAFRSVAVDDEYQARQTHEQSN